MWSDAFWPGFAGSLVGLLALALLTETVVTYAWTAVRQGGEDSRDD